MEHEHHDDFGGLHRDLVATRAAMDRRGLLRMAAGLGVSLSAAQLLGCGWRQSDFAERDGNDDDDRDQ